MRAAHDRLRERGVVLRNAPELPPQCAGVNETNMVACERSLREAGFDEDAIDRKMRHVVLVAEAEAIREGHDRWFKPAMLWDPERFNRAVDTSLEEAAQPRRSAAANARTQPEAVRPRIVTLE